MQSKGASRRNNMLDRGIIMTPLNLTITGAHGIRCGLGRDSLSMDLSQIPDDALTVAIRGENGAGKSTLLNLGLTPWREPPQIAGTVYDQFGDTGLRELFWSHAGESYRTRIEYRNTGKTKTQRAYLHRWHDGGFEPVTLPDHTVSDGKAGTYDACLTHILGPQEIYYLAAFRAQGAPKLADYPDPKGLMRALLNLDEPAALAEKAKDVTRELKRALDGIRDQAKALDEHPSRIVALEFAVAERASEIPQLLAGKTSCQDSSARARAELDRAMSGDLDRQRLIDQRAAAQSRLDGAKASTTVAIRLAEQAHTAAVARVTTAKQEAQRTMTALGRDLLDASLRVSRAQDTLAQRDAIAKAETEAAKIAADIADQEQTVEALAQQVQALRDLAGQIRTLETQRNHAADDGKTCAARLADLTARAGFVAVVPCRGEGQYAECPALKEAKAAEGLIPAAQAEVGARRDAWKSITAQITALSGQVDDLDRIADSHRGAVAIVTVLRGRLDAARKIAAQGAALEIAERNLSEAQSAVADLTARQGDAQADIARQAAILELEADAAGVSVHAAQTDAERQLALLHAELAAIPEPGTDQAVTMARQRLAQADAAVQAAQSAIDQAGAAKAQHEAEIASLRAALTAGEAILAKARKLESEIADWTLLGMGLRGVIDLSIEDAGPGIAALANDLLNTAYGPRFSVRIVTQRDQANGKTVETFDVSVIDSESGMESSILQKSGGEAVILDRCLTDAAALYQQDTAGIHYEVAFADEADGALSADNRRMFYEMERRAMNLGRYGRKYFVSHSPGAWDLADWVIDLADYRADR